MIERRRKGTLGEGGRRWKGEGSVREGLGKKGGQRGGKDGEKDVNEKRKGRQVAGDKTQKT